MSPLQFEHRTRAVRSGLAFATKYASLGLALAVVGTTVGPAHAAPAPELHPVHVTELKSKPPVPQTLGNVALTNNATAHTTPTLHEANPLKTTTPTAAHAVVAPNAYAPPTLTITLVQPALPVEGQPMQVSYKLTNNSSLWPLSGNVIESGNGQEIGFGGVQSIDHLAAGATKSGVISDAAPLAAKGLSISVTLQGQFEDGAGGVNPQLQGGVTCGDCSGTPTSATATTTVDVAGVYYVELDSFNVDQTRSNGLCCSKDTDYVVLAAEQEPSAQQDSATSFGAITVSKGETHTPNSGPLVLGPYYALPDDSNVLVFNYSIVNSGHNPGVDILSAMVQAGLQAAGAAAGAGEGATAGDAASGQGLASLLGSFAGQFFANCDGVVVADQSLPLTGGLLASMTASGPHYETHDDKGSNSPGGCGKNSAYHTTWHISRDNP